MKRITKINFPKFAGIRCLMMPYIQGEPDTVPIQYRTGYEEILASVVLERGHKGFLTIDESPVAAGNPHRGARAKFGRALHTEAGIRMPGIYGWGGGTGWGESPTVMLEADTEILLANNMDRSCAVWDAVHANTSEDGDIGDFADQYPYESATMLNAGEVFRIGILTPHESLPVNRSFNRQFLRIVGEGVHGREPYFTENSLLK